MFDKSGREWTKHGNIGFAVAVVIKHVGAPGSRIYEIPDGDKTAETAFAAEDDFSVSNC
ncbi:MAG TPA: hypothetical protein VF599_05695 [Pyrinomonadaceae bacterium]